MVRTVRVVVVVVGAFLVLSACSGSKQVDAGIAPSGSTSTSAPATTTTTTGAGDPDRASSGTDAITWGPCVTRLAYTKATAHASSPDRNVRRAANAQLRGFPVPTGHEDAWAALLAYNDRYAEVATTMNLADEDEFHKAMNKAMKSELTEQAMEKLDTAELEAILTLGADPPCDPSGLPAGFGCASPDACMQAWAAAAHVHDQEALDLLAQSDMTGDQTPSSTLTAVTCEQDGPFTRCRGEGAPAPGSEVNQITYAAVWAPTADGRWYGVGVTSARFQAVASAIG